MNTKGPVVRAQDPEARFLKAIVKDCEEKPPKQRFSNAKPLYIEAEDSG